MNFCSFCGSKLNERNKCINCNNTQLINNSCNKKKFIISRIFAWISLVLASVPILLVLYVFIESKTSSDTTGLIAPVLIYYYFAMVPNALGSLVFGLISNKIQKNKVAKIGFFVNFFPLVGAMFFITMLLFGLIINLIN